MTPSISQRSAGASRGQRRRIAGTGAREEIGGGYAAPWQPPRRSALTMGDLGDAADRFATPGVEPALQLRRGHARVQSGAVRIDARKIAGISDGTRTSAVSTDPLAAARGPRLPHHKLAQQLLCITHARISPLERR
jgi:hypothetical protein